MELKEIRRRKQSLEQAILNQLRKFEDETGVELDNLVFDRSREMGYDKGNLVSVKMRLSLI